MRRVVVTASIVVLVENMLYSALSPLLPKLAGELALDKTAAGLLVAGYAIGSFAGALPAGAVASRIGPKAAMLAGLVLMAGASALFALGGGFAALFTARLMQGSASALCWTGGIAWVLAVAPSERRGAALGAALGTGIFGAVFGPVIGSLAAVTSREAVYLAVAGLSLALAAWSGTLHDAHVYAPTPGSVRRALGQSTFQAGLAMMVITALLLGVMLVLGPLHLHRAGLGAAAIGAVWLGVAVIQAVATARLGRFADVVGPLRVLRLLLVGAAALCALLTLGGGAPFYVPILLAALVTVGCLYSPTFVLLAEGAELAGLPQGLAFAFMNAGFAVGGAVGPAAAGAIADATGERVPFAAAAGVCVAVLAAGRARAHGRAVATGRVAGS